MNPFLCVIFLLCLSSLAIAANFTQFYEWNQFDFKWPSEASRKQALEAGTFKPEDIEPRYMAVYGTRIFVSLDKYSDGIPVSLVSLPTRRATCASPKLTPFPSWDIHGKGDCNKIEKAKALEVDSVGKLWVLDSGSKNCSYKLWTIDLNKNNHTKLIHRFPFQKFMNDLVIDETPNGTFSYITMLGGQHIAVFSLEKNQSWVVETPGIVTYSIALTPKEEARKLYLSNVDSNELYSVSVAALRKGTRTANPILIGKWNARPYKMLMDNHGTMYAAFLYQNYTSSWNTSQPFEEQRFYEVAGQKPVWPFTFAFDESENLWMTMFDDNTNKSRYRLLKAAVGAKSFKASPELPSLFHQYWLIILICSIVFCVVLLGLIILWLILRQKRNNPLTQNTNDEAQQLSVFRDEQAEVQDEDSTSAAAPLSVPDVGPEEEQCEEFIYDQVAATPPSPGLFEQQICLSSRSARRVRVLPPLPPRPPSFEKFGAAPHAPVEYDDVGPAQLEHLYDDVAP